jgi:hypothetical protein
MSTVKLARKYFFLKMIHFCFSYLTVEARINHSLSLRTTIQCFQIVYFLVFEYSKAVCERPGANVIKLFCPAFMNFELARVFVRLGWEGLSGTNTLV